MAPKNNNNKKKRSSANSRDIRNIECTVEGTSTTKRTSRKNVNDRARGQDVYNVELMIAPAPVVL